MKVAIVGLGPSWREVPWQDTEWQKWGIAHGEFWPMCDVLFEMHDLRLIQRYGKPGRVSNLAGSVAPVYMQEKHEEVPPSVAFPFELADPITRGRYCSTADYPMSLAIAQGAREIGIWGIHLDDPAYHFQAASLNYLIGYARAKGIKVYIPDSSPLGKYKSISAPFGNHMAEYPERYGKPGDDWCKTTS